MKSYITDSSDLELCSSCSQLAIKEITFSIEAQDRKHEITRAWNKSFTSNRKSVSGLFSSQDNVELSVKMKERGDHGLALDAELANRSPDIFHLISFSINFFVASGIPADCLFFHPQNIRFVRIQIPDKESFTRADLFILPDREYRLGNSEDYALPVLIILNKKADAGFVIGASTENIFNKEFILTPEKDGLRIEIIQCFRGISGKDVAPGQSLIFESLFLCDGNAAFDNLLTSYRDEIQRRNKFIFKKSPLRKELIWGSWNMKIHDKQSEDLILRNAEYIKEHFPKVKWVQIDDGWSINRMWGESAYPSLDENVDLEKFPHGMKYVAERIKEMGLKPAIWFSRMCRRDSRLFEEKPDWFALDRFGQPFLPENQFVTLDPSVPEVQNYLKYVFDTILNEWGYMGLKLDFFSEAFYARDMCYRYPGKSGIELMWEMFADVRRRLPDGGYFLPGSIVSNANIFLGKYADIMRYAFDIDELEKNSKLFFQFFQKSALLTLSGSDALVLCNSDAVGYFNYLEERVEKSLAMWCYISGMMMEIGGDLPNADQRRLLALKPLFDKPINGSTGRVLTKEFFISNQTPIVLYNKKHRLIGIFNHSAEQVVTGVVNIKDAGSELATVAKLHEFWTRRTIDIPDGKISYELPPLSSAGYRF